MRWKNVANRDGMSLLEIVAAVILSAMVAMTGLMFLQGHGKTAQERTCMGHRIRLRNDAELFLRENGRGPDSNLEKLRDGNYTGNVLPACPSHGGTDGKTNYRWDGTDVTCGYHR